MRVDDSSAVLAVTKHIHTKAGEMPDARVKRTEGFPALELSSLNDCHLAIKSCLPYKPEYQDT